MSHLSPDAAIACLTLGVALIYWELNRPSSILPGALGLLIVLVSIASLIRTGLQPAGLLLITTAIALLTLGLQYSLPSAVPIAATLALILGLYTATRTPATETHALTSLLCGLTLGAASARLAAIALRARRNKRSARGIQGSARRNKGLD